MSPRDAMSCGRLCEKLPAHVTVRPERGESGVIKRNFRASLIKDLLSSVFRLDLVTPSF